MEAAWFCSVIRIILQFCKENSLMDSFNAIQVGAEHQTEITLNAKSWLQIACIACGVQIDVLAARRTSVRCP